VSSHPAQLRIFISYRRSDTAAAARQLADALKARFGEENVFFDTRDLALGSSWKSEISERVSAADFVLALIGPSWVAIADERGRRRILDPEEEDVLRLEVEAALRGNPQLVPVLVDDAGMPPRDKLPRPFRPVTEHQAVTLRHASWDRDVEDLVSSLGNLSAQRQQEPETPSEERPPQPPGPPPETDGEQAHYETVARHLANGTVVAVLGPGANAGDRDHPWEEGCGWLPDGDELASHLARRFGLDVEPADLARVSQHIFLTEGDVDLYRALREVLIKVEIEPGPVHRFLAQMPASLREYHDERYPLIVTTNYDTALEQAFAAAHEPFDLVVFIANGEHKGRFLHVPWWDGDSPDRGPIEPKPIDDPSGFIDLPIDEELDLTRTVIMKIHGGPAYDAPREFQLKDNFVVTEDDYITYLSRGTVESLVPTQILGKLRESHYLFLGHGMRHWSVRVFLRRIWAEQQHLGAKSWAVQRSLDTVEMEFWERFDVERITVPLSTYVRELGAQLARPRGAPAAR
jgi:hypothetical protein